MADKRARVLENVFAQSPRRFNEMHPWSVINERVACPLVLAYYSRLTDPSRNFYSS